jgi:hypothetical protein
MLSYSISEVHTVDANGQNVLKMHLSVGICNEISDVACK